MYLKSLVQAGFLRFLEIFGAANLTLDCRSRDNKRVSQIGIALTHSAGHISISGRNGNLSSLRSSGSGIDTGSAPGSSIICTPAAIRMSWMPRRRASSRTRSDPY